MRRIALAAATLAAASLLTAGVSSARPACAPGLRPATTAQLFFGRDVGDAPGVSDEDWRAFVDQEVTPRFPGGLTVSDVYGQWRGPHGQFVREPSKALLLVLKGEGDERRGVEAIRAAYVTRFHQQSVLVVEQSACVAF
jgi:hypothetical protein